MLKIDNITIAYKDVPTVVDFSLDMAGGQIVSLVGESGSGKTTVIRAVLGLLAGGGKVTRGDILFNGKSLLKNTQEQWRNLRGSEISMIFQDSGAMMNPTRKIGAVFTEYLQTHEKISKKDAWAKGEEMLEKMRLPSPDNIMRSYPFQLSGGMRQRVGIAMGMTYQPKLLLADEPTSALDVTTQAQIVRQMMELRDDYGTGIIVVTHNLGVAAYMSDYIVVMKDGLIQQVDSPQNLYSYPCNTFVAGFIGSPQMNFLDGTLKKTGDQFVVDLSGTEVPLPKEKTADGKLDAYVGKTLKVGIRPEDIKDDEEFLEKHPNSHLSAEVEVSELMGAEIYLYLTYQGQNLMARVAPTSKSRRGDKITVAMDTNKIHLFDPETEKTLLN